MKRMIFATPLLAFLALSAPLTSCSDKDHGLGNVPIYKTSVVSTSDRDSINSNVTSSRRNAITHAVSIASPAVVGINVTEIREQQVYDPFDGMDDPFFRQFFQHRGRQVQKYKVEGLGSGFLISSDGYILTN